ncbi:hypothetical protein CBR_g66634 [Chara braunii]|uniref:F-box domain-containing protein n=1 Tax=Chara braunii TaxID=69332 RepID=A0A388JPW7_CHABU|nr:hypothetical protein CBR_g66634 [Chara braunii]|eukprot:GBG59830.1 hypothetical protein CBR_g66634 [Chara braunii]
MDYAPISICGGGSFAKRASVVSKWLSVGETLPYQGEIERGDPLTRGGVNRLECQSKTDSESGNHSYNPIREEEECQSRTDSESGNHSYNRNRGEKKVAGKRGLSLGLRASTLSRCGSAGGVCCWRSSYPRRKRVEADVTAMEEDRSPKRGRDCAADSEQEEEDGEAGKEEEEQQQLRPVKRLRKTTSMKEEQAKEEKGGEEGEVVVDKERAYDQRRLASSVGAVHVATSQSEEGPAMERMRKRMRCRGDAARGREEEEGEEGEEGNKESGPDTDEGASKRLRTDKYAAMEGEKEVDMVEGKEEEEEGDPPPSTDINSLPDSLLVNVLCAIGDAKSLFKCAAVCRRFNQLVWKVPELSFKVECSRRALEEDYSEPITEAIRRTADLRVLNVKFCELVVCRAEVVQAWLRHVSNHLTHFSLVVSPSCNVERGILHHVFYCALNYCRNLRHLEVDLRLQMQTVDLKSLLKHQPLESLEYLSITRVDFSKDPDFVRSLLTLFPNLKTLKLSGIKGPKEVILESPLLEVFELEGSRRRGRYLDGWVDRVVIDAPCLQELVLRSVKSFRIESSPGPKKLELYTCLDKSFPDWSNRLSTLSVVNSAGPSAYPCSSSSASYFGDGGGYGGARVDEAGQVLSASDIASMISSHRRSLTSLSVDMAVSPMATSEEKATFLEAFCSSYPCLKSLSFSSPGFMDLVEGCLEVLALDSVDGADELGGGAIIDRDPNSKPQPAKEVGGVAAAAIATSSRAAIGISSSPLSLSSAVVENAGRACGETEQTHGDVDRLRDSGECSYTTHHPPPPSSSSCPLHHQSAAAAAIAGGGLRACTQAGLASSSPSSPPASLQRAVFPSFSSLFPPASSSASPAAAGAGAGDGYGAHLSDHGNDSNHNRSRSSSHRYHSSSGNGGVSVASIPREGGGGGGGERGRNDRNEEEEEEGGARSAAAIAYAALLSWINAPDLESLSLVVGRGSIATVHVIRQFLETCPRLRAVHLTICDADGSAPAFFEQIAQLRAECIDNVEVVVSTSTKRFGARRYN